MVKSPLFYSLIFLFFIQSSLKAQLPRDAFPLTREFKKGGFYFSPQLIYTIGYNDEGSYTFQDSSYTYDVSGSGKLGFGGELGWFHSFKRKQYIQLLETGVAYRMVKGSATHDGTLSIGSETQSFNSNNEFSTQLIVASLRAKKIDQLGKYSFLTTALGLNYNYQLSQSLKRTSPYPLDNENALSTSSIQLHFQIGLGFKVSRKLMIIPTLETPLLLLDNFTAKELEDLNPAFPYFGTKFHPLIFGLTFQFIREDPENCNAPTYDPSGLDLGD